MPSRPAIARADAKSPASLPSGLEPMLSTLSTLPPNADAYGFEFKWDGIRALAYVKRGALKLVSRRRNDITPQYPELQALAAEHPDRVAVFDGEIVALDAS